jgi:hypothetical protein
MKAGARPASEPRGRTPAERGGGGGAGTAAEPGNPRPAGRADHSAASVQVQERLDGDVLLPVAVAVAVKPIVAVPPGARVPS